MTILKTQSATIKGSTVTVKTVLGESNRQDVKYLVNDRQVSYNNFWKLNPKFKN